MTHINKYIFRRNSVRGVYDRDISADIFRQIGQQSAGALGRTVVVGRDHRLSSPELTAALCEGLMAAGSDVIDVGLATRGMTIYAGWKLGLWTAYVTASHLTAEWNGLKFSDEKGLTASTEVFDGIRARVLAGAHVSGERRGACRKMDIKAEFMSHVQARVPPLESKMKVLVDCGNGTAGLIAPELLSNLGCEVTPLFAELDGSFPNRPSEIDEQALQAAAGQMKGQDLGMAYDGDADRMTLLAGEGMILDAEHTAAIILNELLKGRKGDIVANAGCGKVTDFTASKFGRSVVRVPVGTAYMLRKVAEIGAAFGVESSMHMCIPDLLPFDDGVAVSAYAAYAASALRSKADWALNELLAELPVTVKRHLNRHVSDAVKFEVMDRIREYALSRFKNVDLIDGVRIQFEGGWAQVRASDTSPLIRVAAEAETEDLARQWVDEFGKFLPEEETE